jgi:phospho-N-acetylmuramoyl-pentapeptide-transferase
VIAVMIAGAVATLVSLLGTRFLIVFFRTRGRGQPILGKEDHGPEHHMIKQGTPTMGGLAIVVAAFVGWIAAHIRNIAFSDQALIVWFGILAMSFMGFLDDWIKVRKGHNRGIFWKQKNYITMLMSFGFAWWLVATPGISETISFVRAGDLNFEVPTLAWVIWAGLVIWATTNAVNVTDGLDGLAGGSALMGFGAFMIIGYWAFRNPDVYGAVVNPLDMGVMAAGFAGACLGFLWWNAAPARIFMGDTGSLALGGLFAGLSMVTRTELLLVVLGGVFVVEALSVVLQVAVFRTTRRRPFRMAPFHHHFELAGWAETTVIIRFWLLAAICCALGLGLFYSEWLAASGG